MAQNRRFMPVYSAQTTFPPCSYIPVKKHDLMPQSPVEISIIQIKLGIFFSPMRHLRVLFLKRPTFLRVGQVIN